MFSADMRVLGYLSLKRFKNWSQVAAASYSFLRLKVAAAGFATVVFTCEGEDEGRGGGSGVWAGLNFLDTLESVRLRTPGPFFSTSSSFGSSSFSLVFPSEFTLPELWVSSGEEE